MGRGETVPALRRYRALAAMTQAELAEKAGVDKHTISRLEAGVVGGKARGADFKTIRKLAEALGVQPRDLMGE